ncbi:MAG TPA: 2-phospho-L-lactate guanylyltransferase [Terriglobales bacterium]|nr:2-phospho-L-lactate guanylyltransferase [Terriglobales bacterium]
MILIPVKNQQNAKQRLAEVLTQEQRQALAEAMLADVLQAVAGLSARPEVALVTSDPFAVGLAHALDFRVIADEDNRGETAAIEMATHVAVEHGAEWTLVIPADAPLVTAGELESILYAAPEAGAVLAPDHRGRGSNAVLRRPAALFPLRFGDDSFAPHVQAASATGRSVVLLQLPGIALDVDRPDELAMLANAPGETRSQLLARAWGVAQAAAPVS